MAKNEVMSLLLQAEMDLEDVRELTLEELAAVTGGLTRGGRNGHDMMRDDDTGCHNDSCNISC
jgi:hypothetical protein